MSNPYIIPSLYGDEPTKPKAPRAPRRVGSSSAVRTPSRISNYWGVQSNPRPVGAGLIKAVESDQTLQTFFQMLYEHRQEQINLRMEREAYLTNLDRDQDNKLERYAAQHQYDMDALGFGEAAKNNDPYDLQGIFQGLKNSPADLGVKGINKNDPTYGVKTKDLRALASAGLEGEELSDFMLDMVQAKLDRSEFRAESRSFELQDEAKQADSLEAYAAKYEDRIERLAAQNGVTNPVIPYGTGTGSPVGTATNHGSVEDLFGKPMKGSAGIDGADSPDEDEPKPDVSSEELDNSAFINNVMKGSATIQDKNLFMDAVKGRSFGGGGANTGKGFAGEQSFNALMWAVDKVSRPYYAVSAGMDEFYKLDPDDDKDWEDQGGIKGWIGENMGDSFISNLMGKNPSDSYDDFSVGKIFGAMKDGFTSGGVLGMSEDPTLGHEIIASNAERNPEKTFHDKGWYQHTAGFGVDVLGDPLSYTGIGIGSGLARGSTRRLAKAVKPHDEKLMKTSEEVAEALKGEDAYLSGLSPSLFDAGKPVDAKRVYNLLGGNFKYTRSGAHKADVTRDVNRNVDVLSDLLERQVISADTSGTKAIQALAEGLKTRKTQVVESFKDDVYMESLRAELGKVGVPMEDFDSLLTTHRMSQHMDSLHRYGKTELEAAKRTGFGETRVNGKRMSELDHYMDRVRILKSEGKTAEAAKLEEKFNSKLEEVIELSKTDKDFAKFGGSPLKDLIPELKHDYRFQGKDTNELYRLAKRASYEDITIKNLRDRSFSILNDSIKPKRARVKSLEAAGKDSGWAIRELENAQIMKDRVDHMLRLAEADIMVRVMKHYVAGAKNPHAEGLESLLKTIREEKQAIASGKKTNVAYTGLKDEGSPLGPETMNPELNTMVGRSDAPNKGFFATDDGGKASTNQTVGTETYMPINSHTKGDTRPTDFVDEQGNWSPKVLDPDAEFFDRASHLDYLEQELVRQLKKVSKLPDSERKLLSGIPETFKGADDAVDMGKVRNYIRFDAKQGEFIRKKVDDEAVNEWTRHVEDVLLFQYNKAFDGIWRPKKTKIEEIEAAKGTQTGGKKSKEFWDSWKAAEAESKAAASKIAYDYVENSLKHNNLYKQYSSKFELENAPVTEAELLKAIKWKHGEEYATAVAKANEAKKGAPHREVARIDRELKELRELHASQLAAEKKAFAEAKEARVIMKKRLEEDAILRIGAIKMAEKEKHLSIRTWGDRELFAIPGSRHLFNAAEKIGGVKGISDARQHWANAFVSPTSRLPEEMRVMRARALSEPHVVIKFTIQKLQKQFEGHDRVDREAAFEQWLKGTDEAGELHPEAQGAIKKAFDDLLPHFTGQTKVGGETLTRDEINAYLKGYGVEVRPVKGGIKTSQDLVRSIHKIGEGTKKQGRNVPRMMKDPFELAWNLSVAKELAMARKGLQDNIKQMFGVRRGVTFNEHGAGIGKILDDETTTVIEKLKVKHGWDTSERLDKNYLFPPEILPDINRLMDMLEPAAIQDFARLFDKATGHWKMMTTIYNPGYWSRNGIGEAMSSWLAGVHDPRWYAKSQKLISYARHDSKDIEQVASRLPGIKIRSNKERGAEVAFTIRKSGQKVTYADVWAMAHDTGIKTNFFDTEFSRVYSKTGDKLRNAPVVGGVMKGHDTMRHAGEWYEDYWRMAHFMHAIEKSNKRSLKGAAEEAAAEVRKYHFDYTDFTNLEKASLLRAFPFYKWTRKALPLMVSMMFLKPGKIMGYNKAMNSYSNAQDGRTNDTDGFMPTYSDMVPQWIKDQWAYKIGQDTQGKNTYLNIATPQMDSYKALSNPVGTASSLLNPLIKFPLDEFMMMKQGSTTGSRIGQDDEFEKSLGTKDPTELADLREILSKTPLTEFMSRMAGFKGTEQDPDKDMKFGEYLQNDTKDGSLALSEGLMKFLTGLGIYEQEYGK